MADIKTDPIQDLKDQLTAISQEQSTMYHGESKLKEAWYMCSSIGMFGLNDVLFRIVKRGTPIPQAVDEGIQAYPEVFQKTTEQIAEEMLEHLKKCLIRYDPGYTPPE